MAVCQRSLTDLQGVCVCLLVASAGVVSLGRSLQYRLASRRVFTVLFCYLCVILSSSLVDDCKSESKQFQLP